MVPATRFPAGELYRYDPMAETPDDDLDVQDDIRKIAHEYVSTSFGGPISAV